MEREPLGTNSGRGEVCRVFHPKGILVERPYRHGGMRRLVLPEIFLKTERASREFEIHQAVYARGISTIEPVGWREVPVRLPFFRRYFFYTRYLEGAMPLPRWLKTQGASNGLLAQMARILHQLFEMGIFHYDINLNNWLVHEGTVFLIDFDRAATTEQKAKKFLEACIRRMVRSGKKLGFVGRKILFFRFLLIACSQFNLNPRHVLAAISPSLFRKRFYHDWIWKISGGHR